MLFEHFLLVHLKISFLNFVSRAFHLFSLPPGYCTVFASLFSIFFSSLHRCSLSRHITISWAWKSIWNVCLSSGTLIGLCFQNSPKRHIYALSEIIINMFCTFGATCQAYFFLSSLDREASMNATSKWNVILSKPMHECRTQNIYHKVFNKEIWTFPTNFFRFSIFMLFRLSKTWVFHWYGSKFPFCHTIGRIACVHNSKIHCHVNHEVFFPQQMLMLTLKQIIKIEKAKY